MNRRGFLAGTVTTASVVVAGCLGETDHETELESEIERRGVGVREIITEDDTMTVEYDSEDVQQDLAEVAMAFVERIDDGWRIDRLDGVARGETDATWYAEGVWAREYLDGDIDAGEYGNRISETLQMAVIVDDEDVDDQNESSD